MPEGDAIPIAIVGNAPGPATLKRPAPGRGKEIVSRRRVVVGSVHDARESIRRTPAREGRPPQVARDSADTRNMRRLLSAVVVGAVALAACDAPVAESTTTTTAETTTAPETSTTTAATTTTTSATTTTTAEPREAANSPMGTLDSFRWLFLTDFSNDEGEGLLVQTEGVYVGGDFECSITAGLGGLEFTYGLVMIGDTAWVDDGTGSGYVILDSTDPQVTDSLGICPGSPVFWADITGGDPLPLGGDPEERNGVATRRLDLTGILSEASGLGLFPSEVDGVDFEELVFWVAEEGDWVTSVSMKGSLDPEAFADLTGSEVATEGSLLVTLDVTDADNPELVVSAP